ncbi:MAG TPA: 1-acyl-sn-glycerol-3-phosphate acyltransferase [Burkholderiales bacterium]|nr:1-acyl-sn-glycerol-3-phosphate acyltransferase [Burkholderiales bacterium]
MADSVTLPVWAFVVLGALAAWTAFDKLVVPALRWMVTSPANRVIDELSTRLRIGIRPFQRTRRQALIHRLLTDPKVQQAAERFASERGVPLSTALQAVERYAREIVPAFNAYLYFRIGYWLGRTIARALYRVRIGYIDSEGIARIDPEATVVVVMNHRSNMDYVLAGYLAADQAALSYAVGEWARLWPLGALVRAMGAYFVRRNSKEVLYRRVLERYIAMATEAGVPQAVFPEGGLSRDGRLREPRLGVLDYMLRGFRRDGERDLVFVPLGINYDRVLEDRTLLLSADPAARRPGRFWAAWNTLGFVVRNLSLALRSRWYRFGYACLNFGAPISMREYCAARDIEFQRLAPEARKEAVATLGQELMGAVAAIVPVVPVALMAQAFAQAPDVERSELELKAQAGSILESLAARGAHVYVPRGDLDYALGVGLRMLRLRRLVEEHDGLYRVNPGEAPLISFYANSIAHHLDSSGRSDNAPVH